jgi:hypothetical protein
VTPDEVAALARTRLVRVMEPDDATTLVGHEVPDLAATVTGPTVALDADTGLPVLAYLPLGDVAGLWAAVRAVRIAETYRAASGRRNKSRTFGWAPRRPVQRREACNATSFAQEQPAQQAELDRWAVRCTALIRAIDPTVADRDEATMREVLPEWHMADTPWTSGVVNANSQLPYHRDGFNFPTWSAMPVLRRGMDGGHLHLPEYDATVACRDGWGVFFCGFELVHGVTPMRRRSPGGYRFSVVYYALRGMRSCAEFAEETRLARRTRSERELRIASGEDFGQFARAALRRHLADRDPAARVKLTLTHGRRRLYVASLTDPGITEWQGYPVEWVPGTGKDGADAPGPADAPVP